MNAFDGRVGGSLQRALMVGAWFLVGLIALGIAYTASSMRYIGSGISAANTIVVSGEGEAYAVPDLGEFTFSVTSEKVTVKAAQEDATAKANALTTYLKSAGVEEKDIKTIYYSVSPKYEYKNVVCPQGSYCPGGNQVLMGYEVSQTTQVKVRDTAKAGDLLSGVGEKGATNVSGLQFTVDDPQAIEAEARQKAIDDAKEKAERLARELGVSLVRVTAFSENGGGGYPTPVYSLAADSRGNLEKAVAPEISVGQNKVVSSVSITYEIR